MKKTTTREFTTIITHNGKFHNDEVCAIALLHLGNIGEYQVTRTRDAEAIASADYVVDVGGVYDCEAKRFDHHQKEYDGNKSSAGMVWEYLVDEDIVDEDIVFISAYDMVCEVDYRDLNGPINTQVHHEFFELINELNQDDIYSSLQDEAFLFAVDSYIRYIRTGFKIPNQLVAVASSNKAAKAEALQHRLDNLEFYIQNGKKSYVGDYIPASELPKDWDFFLSYDKGQSVWTVLANTEKGHFLTQGQGVFTHKGGFMSKIQASAWAYCSDGSDGFKDAVYFTEDGNDHRYEIPVGEIYYR